jgi:hypothetical protein
MSQPAPKPLPDSIRRAIAQAVGNCRGKIELTTRVHCNKQMTLTLWRGSVGGVVLRLHKRAHRTFYQIVAAAKRLLANLMAALADPLPAQEAAPIVAPAPASSEAWRTCSNVGKDTPSGKEKRAMAVHSKYLTSNGAAPAQLALSPRQIYERNVRFNRAKVMAQVAAGLQ